jgi:hypothetical protein
MIVSKLKHRKPSGRARPAKPGARRASVFTVAIVLAIGILTAVILLRGREPGATGSPQPSPPAPGSSLAATADSANSGFRALEAAGVLVRPPWRGW